MKKQISERTAKAEKTKKSERPKKSEHTKKMEIIETAERTKTAEKKQKVLTIATTLIVQRAVDIDVGQYVNGEGAYEPAR